MRVLNLIVGLGFSLLFPSSSLFFFFFFLVEGKQMRMRWQESQGLYLVI